MVESDIKENAWEILETVQDPEIPVLSVVDLGVIRSIEIIDGQLVVTITPTYSGCPAMEVIEREVKAALVSAGYTNTVIKSVISPPWTTDWISESGKQKLFEYGISPPEESSFDKSEITGHAKHLTCPNCKSTDTVLKSQFGSTPCKSLYVCNACHEPFDHFKCI
jgi:ring-1,2-phenylacetyl-CoA epoxidase subunit PaaD